MASPPRGLRWRKRSAGNSAWTFSNPREGTVSYSTNFIHGGTSIMAFCVSCGSQLPETGRFCTNCGTSVNAAAGSSPGPAATHQPLDYTIQGDNLQVIRIRLQPGQELFAEAGKMVYKQPQVAWETRMTGETLGEKIWGAVKRKLMGESLFMTYFRASTPGEVGFAGSYPGRVQAFDLKAG